MAEPRDPDQPDFPSGSTDPKSDAAAPAGGLIDPRTIRPGPEGVFPEVIPSFPVENLAKQKRSSSPKKDDD
jgi:hypothetical protein